MSSPPSEKLSTRSDMLSRLKGIETQVQSSPNNSECYPTFRYAFPFEGN